MKTSIWGIGYECRSLEAPGRIATVFRLAYIYRVHCSIHHSTEASRQSLWRRLVLTLRQSYLRAPFRCGIWLCRPCKQQTFPLQTSKVAKNIRHILNLFTSWHKMIEWPTLRRKHWHSQQLFILCVITTSMFPLCNLPCYLQYNPPFCFRKRYTYSVQGGKGNILRYHNFGNSKQYIYIYMYMCTIPNGSRIRAILLLPSKTVDKKEIVRAVFNTLFTVNKYKNSLFVTK
jgi:hypothetical protein